MNLIGEHTDYNEGLVLPCAIDRATAVVAAAREDGVVRAWSREEAAEARFALGAAASGGNWADYVRGAALALAEAGHRLCGADLAIGSDVPRGAGLSSSAALCVAVTLALARTSGIALAPRELAELAHRAESHFAGIGCGILDHFASALGRRDHALRIDCRSRSVEPVKLMARAAWLVVDSGSRRSLARSGYPQRVAECAAALEAAKRAGLVSPDASALRDVPEAAWPGLKKALPDLLARRAFHVLTENARVDALVDALRDETLRPAGTLLRASHASLRDDYGVSTPELDALCAIGDATPGCHGSRLTGAGFGGCTLHLVDPDAADIVSRALADGFAARFGRAPRVWRVRAADGAGELVA